MYQSSKAFQLFILTMLAFKPVLSDYHLQFGTQVALASLECVQPAVLVSDEQSASLLSFPVQPMFVKEIGPLPGPNAAPDCAVASANRNVHINYEIEYRIENMISR